MKNSIDSVLETRCAHYRVEKQHVLEVYDVIKPMLDTASYNVNLDAVIESREIIDVARKLQCNTAVLKLEGAEVDYQNSNTWLDIYYKTKTIGLTEKEQLVFDAVTYMILIENIYSPIVNILCHARINKDAPPSQCKILKCHTTFEDISTKVDLSDKIKFLSSDYSELVDACDLNLRNSAAHMRFCLVPDIDMVNERHVTSTSFSLSNSIRIRKHGFYMFKKENQSWTLLDNTPTNLKDKLTKLMSVTYSWHVALLHYQAIKFVEEIDP